MTTTRTCRVCGASLGDATSSGGLCPVCLMRVGLTPEPELDSLQRGHLALPHTFGSYELIEELGRGGMGVVYAARQPALNRTVAVKLLLSGAYASEAALERFRTEAAAAAGLQHPNIVEIHDYGEWEGQPYYVMDLIRGQNLAQMCDGRPLDAQRAATILRELADAVHYAHQLGVLHRDLKPSNVLLDERDHVRITDFGLARRLGENSGVTQIGQVMGSPGYASPEQSAGRIDEVGVRSDVYGLGAILYHLITGRAPFNAATPTETLRLVLESDPLAPRLLNPTVPRDLETICLKCLAKEPPHRYASAAEVGADIERYLQHRPIAARSPGVIYRTRKFARRYRTGVAAVAAVIVALSLGLTAALISNRRTVVQQRATEAARARAQQIVASILEELRPQIEALGRQKALATAAKTALDYFNQLPLEMRDPKTVRAHAHAWEFLAESVEPFGFRLASGVSRETIHAFIEAGRLWRQLADADPNDGEAHAKARFGQWLEDSQLNSTARPEEISAIDRRYLGEMLELEKRFPHEPSLQLNIVRALRGMGAETANLPKETHAQGIADALEARARNQRMIEVHPDAPMWRIEMTHTLSCLAMAYLGEGRTADRVQCFDDAMDVANSLLAEDPTHFRYLNVATALANLLAATEVSDRRRLERVAVARPIVRMLQMMDPTVVEWRIRAAWLESLEANSLASLRRFDEAQAPVDRAVELHRDLAAQGGNIGGYIRCIAEAGIIAASRGDTPAAVDCLQLLRGELTASWTSDADAEYEKALREYASLFWQCRVLEALEDWAGLEAAARGMIRVVNERATNIAGAERARNVLRYCARALQGEALLRMGRPKEASPALEEAMGMFEPGGHPGPVFEQFSNTRMWDVPLNLAFVSLEDGDTTRAAQLLENILRDFDWHLSQRQATATGGWLESRVKIAHSVWVLAEAWHPDEAGETARRIDLLTRAATLLEDPEFDPALWPDREQLRGQIAAELNGSSPEVPGLNALEATGT